MRRIALTEARAAQAVLKLKDGGMAIIPDGALAAGYRAVRRFGQRLPRSPATWR